MNPAAIIALVQLMEVAVQEEPAFAAAVQKLFAKGAPTPADWSALRNAIASETYEQFVPNTQLPPEPPQKI